MLKTLYDIQAQHAALVSELLESEGELTPELEMDLSINEDELEVKAEGYALRILEFNGQADFIDAEIKRLQSRKSQLDKTAERLKETIRAAMVQFKKEKIKTERITLSFRKSEVVEVPETFADEILQFVTIKAELDQKKIEAVAEQCNAVGAKMPEVPSVEMLDYFKLTATVDKTKIKIALKDEKTVGDVMLLTKKNLQIK